MNCHPPIEIAASPHVILERVHLPSGFRVPEHSHVHPHVLVLLRGSILEVDDRRSVLLEGGGSRLSPAGDSHSIRGGRDGAECLVIHISPALLSRGFDPGLIDRVFLQSERIRRRGGELLREAEGPMGGSSLVADQLALEIVAQALRPRRESVSASPPGWLDHACDVLRDSVSNPPSLASLADIVGRHPVHLSRAFRQHVGCTAGEYIRTYRIEAARGLVLLTDRSLGEIAFACGFADQSHMTRQFRARLGVTPGHLRSARSGTR